MNSPYDRGMGPAPLNDEPACGNLGDLLRERKGLLGGDSPFAAPGANETGMGNAHVIYRVGDTIYIHLATDVLQHTADILEASQDWPRDASRLHVEMRNWINELYAEIQHREKMITVAQKIALPDTAFDPPAANTNENLR